MFTVETDPVAVEERLGSGRLACQRCSGLLAEWGRALGRQVRDTDGGSWITPWRSWCSGCGATHVLLPVVLLLRRADTAAVLGARAHWARLPGLHLATFDELDLLANLPRPSGAAGSVLAGRRSRRPCPTKYSATAS